jgi:hypothetical protein
MQGNFYCCDFCKRAKHRIRQISLLYLVDCSHHHILQFLIIWQLIFNVSSPHSYPVLEYFTNFYDRPKPCTCRISKSIANNLNHLTPISNNWRFMSDKNSASASTSSFGWYSGTTWLGVIPCLPPQPNHHALSYFALHYCQYYHFPIFDAHRLSMQNLTIAAKVKWNPFRYGTMISNVILRWPKKN